MNIIVDTRQKDSKHTFLHNYLEKQGLLFFCKLPVGDYANYDTLSSKAQELVNEADKINRNGEKVSPLLSKEINNILLSELSTSVDTKQDMSEVYVNLVQDHKRFKRELIKAQDNKICLSILVEHGHGITTLDDVRQWNNPRTTMYYNSKAQGLRVPRLPPRSSQALHVTMETLQRRYSTTFLFCRKSETGHIILQLLQP